MINNGKPFTKQVPNLLLFNSRPRLLRKWHYIYTKLHKVKALSSPSRIPLALDIFEQYNHKFLPCILRSYQFIWPVMENQWAQPRPSMRIARPSNLFHPSSFMESLFSPFNRTDSKSPRRFRLTYYLLQHSLHNFLSPFDVLGLYYQFIWWV